MKGAGIEQNSGQAIMLVESIEILCEWDTIFDHSGIWGGCAHSESYLSYSTHFFKIIIARDTKKLILVAKTCFLYKISHINLIEMSILWIY